MVDAPGKVTLWGIEIFAAVAEEGSVSSAARRLGAAPSSISQQISNLETALGATLLDRGARPVALTPAGQLFRARAQTILSEAAAARAELALQDYARLMQLNLGVIEDFDADLTPRLLTALAAEMPQTRFLLETGASHRLFDQLEARALDVVLGADLGVAADWAEVHPVLEEPFVAALPKGAGIEAHTRLPLIQYTARHHMGRVISAHLATQGIAPDRRFEIDSYHAILAMVAEGQGWTILTPLGIARAGRFARAVDMAPLPFAPLSRRIVLTARRETLQDLPSRMAAQIRDLLDAGFVPATRAAAPWLGDSLRLI